MSLAAAPTVEPQEQPTVGYILQPKQIIASIMAKYADHICFGGAMGPGKTAWALHEIATQSTSIPGLHSLVGRRTNKELRTLRRKLRLIVPEWMAKLNTVENEMHWTYPGAIHPREGESWVRFSQFFREEDVDDHKGEEYNLIFLDEAAHFTQSQRDALMARNRYPIKSYPKKMYFPTNPGSIGHHDFLTQFVKPTRYRDVELLAYWDWSAPSRYPGVIGDIRAFPPDTRGAPSGEDGYARYIIWRPPMTPEWEAINEERIQAGLDPSDPPARVYIPGVVQDNKYLWEDPSYVATLMALPEKQRRMYFRGDWDAFEGQVFEEWDEAVHVLPQDFEILDHWPKWRSLDWGYREPLAALWHAFAPELNLVITYRELYERGLTDRDATDRIKLLSPAEEQRWWTTWADPSMFRQDGIGEEVHSHGEMFEEYGVPLERAINNREAGLQRVRDYLQLNLQARPRRAYWACTPNCKHLIRTLPTLVYDTNRPEDVDTTGEDHLYDALRYGLMGAPSSARPSRSKPMLAGEFYAF